MMIAKRCEEGPPIGSTGHYSRNDEATIDTEA